MVSEGFLGFQAPLGKMAYLVFQAQRVSSGLPIILLVFINSKSTVKQNLLLEAYTNRKYYLA